MQLPDMVIRTDITQYLLCYHIVVGMLYIVVIAR